MHFLNKLQVLLDDIAAEIASIAAPNPFGKRDELEKLSIGIVANHNQHVSCECIIQGEAAILYPKELRQYESEFYVSWTLKG